MLASIGAAAKRGLLIKGGKYIESLARADVLLVDKTGTITMGRPQVTDVIPLNGLSADELLGLTASVEHDSEHPLAAAVRDAAADRRLPLTQPSDFEAIPGQGVRARLNGHAIAVGNRRLVPAAAGVDLLQQREDDGKTLLFVARDMELVGAIEAADTVRSEVPAALEQVRALGIQRIELLTGDTEQTAATRTARNGATGLLGPCGPYFDLGHDLGQDLAAMAQQGRRGNHECPPGPSGTPATLGVPEYCPGSRQGGGIGYLC